LIIGAVIRRVIGFETVAKVTLVLSAVFTNVSGVVAFVTNDTRVLGERFGAGMNHAPTVAN